MAEPGCHHSPQDIYNELEQAVYDLSSRGLHQAARWAAEQMAGLDPGLLRQATSIAESGSMQPLRMDSLDRAPQYMLARQHFEFKEYRRAASVLEGLTGAKALFFKCWCLYLAGEKRKEEERDEVGEPKCPGGSAASADAPGLPGVTRGGVLLLNSTQPQGAAPVNQELGVIETLLRDALTGGWADAFCVYLLGLVLSDQHAQSEATDMLLLSVRSYPVNWGAWQALQRLVVDAHSLRALPADPDCLPLTHWATDFFLAACSLDLQENMEALSRLQRLSHVFPQSLTVEAMVAQAQYNLQNFEDAQVLFEDLLSRDPYRLEGLDTFSNILFVKEQPAALSLLAQRAMSTDKYRAESCCVVGNYYSLKGSHEQAVVWFRRALSLQRTCLAAWTLMGHEFMELKNTAAAIEAYRAAVELSSHDYRAWYGLGQAHELMKLPYYALYYYRRAAALRPGDARMWCALGQCYASEQVCNQDMAAKCFQRAVDQQDPEGVALHLLAKLRESRGELAEAERLHRANLARLDAESGAGAGGAGGGCAPPLVSSDAVDALLFLAGHCKSTGRLTEARALCERLMDVGGAPREHAKALAREITALLVAPPAAGSTAGEVSRDPGQHVLAGVAGGLGGGQVGGGGVTPGSGVPVWPGHEVGGSHGGRNLLEELGQAQAGGSTQVRRGGHQGGGGRPSPLACSLAGTPPLPPLFLGIRLGDGGEAALHQVGGMVTPAGCASAPGLFGGQAGSVHGGSPGDGEGMCMDDSPAAAHVQGLGESSVTPDVMGGQAGRREAGGRLLGDVATPGAAAGVQMGGPGGRDTLQGVGAAAAGGSQGLGKRSREHEAVMAVAQQLRVREAHAASLLAAAAGDPIAAIRSNLHLMGPCVEA